MTQCASHVWAAPSSGAFKIVLSIFLDKMYLGDFWWVFLKFTNCIVSIYHLNKYLPFNASLSSTDLDQECLYARD